MGVSFPFSATMFILVGGLAAQGVMQPDEIVLPLTFAGLWCLGYRLVLSYWLVRQGRIEPIDPGAPHPVRPQPALGVDIAAAVRADPDPAGADPRADRRRARRLLRRR